MFPAIRTAILQWKLHGSMSLPVLSSLGLCRQKVFELGTNDSNQSDFEPGFISLLVGVVLNLIARKAFKAH
jgi:hypothetical protein